MLKEFFRERLGTKLLSISLALLLELYFFNPQNLITKEIGIEIELRNIPKSMMVTSPPNAERKLIASATVEGPTPRIDSLEPFGHKMVVEFPPKVSGKFRTVLRPDGLILPSGVTVVSIEPRAIEFHLEKVIKKNLAVAVDYSGEPADGYQLKKVSVTPDVVIARGPLSELEGLSVSKTRKIDITGFTTSKTMEVALSEFGILSGLNVNVVSVRVEVEPIVEERKFERVSVKVLAPKGQAATVEPSSVGLVAKGPKPLLDKLAKGAFALIADGRNLGEGRHEVPLKGEFPEDVEIIRTIPAVVVLTTVATNG